MRRATALLLSLVAVASVAATTPDDEAPALGVFASFDGHTSQLHVWSTADDRRTGGSGITSVELVIEGERYDLPSADGAYGDPYEEAELRLVVTGPERTIEVCGTARDAAGNEATDCDTVSTVDDTAPQVSAIRTAETPVSHLRPVELHAVVEDGQHDVAGARVSVDDGRWQPMSAADGAFDSRSEQVVADLGRLEAGEHVVCVEAVDSVGNQSSSFAFDGFAVACVTLEVVDDAAPELQLSTSPSDPVFGELFEVTATATDLTGGAVTVWFGGIDGGRAQVVSGSTADGAGVTTTDRMLRDAPGPVELCAAAEDQHGNTSTLCTVVQVGDTRWVEGTGTMTSGRPLLPGDDAQVDLSVSETFDGTLDGFLTYRDNDVAFVATEIAAVDFRPVDVVVQGSGELNGVPCDFRAVVRDENDEDDFSISFDCYPASGVANTLAGDGSLLTGDLVARGRPPA